MGQREGVEGITTEDETLTARRAKDRAKAARWSLEIAIFLHTVLIIVIILLFQEVGLETVGLVAIFGLGMAWLGGWRQGKALYKRYYTEELAAIVRERILSDSTVEDIVQRFLRERWR
jgi:hypothetical protein